jgi:aminopeptidase N
LPRLDPHSYADSSQPAVVALGWRAHVDFAARILDCEARLELAAPAAEGPLDLDTRELAIAGVTDGEGRALRFELAPPDPILGARLRITLAPGTTAVIVTYRTSPSASALQWLDPAQTAGGRAPFLYSQCQAIHARSIVPLPDTPRARLRFRAELTVPRELQALCGAAFVSRDEEGARARVRFAMDQPIPPYLFAFAVGELEPRELGPRSRVWAEPSLAERAAWEFAGLDALLAAAERLFGPYAWERFDLVVMPPAFPYGGMENPRLAFLTPTLLAGDRSLVDVVAHELAHAWTGNLVSNANAEHFWLNEGFTVWAERRILEELSGVEAARRHAQLGRRELDRAIADLAARPELTQLRTRLAGIDTDEAFSIVPYEKGYLFLRALEDAVGRPRFDGFVRAWLDAHRFGAVTTDDFLAFASAQLPDALARVDARRWLDEPGLAADAAPVAPPIAHPSTPVEWRLYLEDLPRPVPIAELERLAPTLMREGASHEILVPFLALGIEAGWAPAIARAETVLATTGRLKYLKMLYVALAQNPATQGRAGFSYRFNKARYHSIAQNVLVHILRTHRVPIHEVNPLPLGRGRK